MNKSIDKIEIKPLQSPTLTAVSSNALFREITAAAYVNAFYNVNGSRCIGLTFENIDEATISRLRKFCTKTMLEVIFMAIPWRENITVAFIRKAVTNWLPSCLKNISRNDIFE